MAILLLPLLSCKVTEKNQTAEEKPHLVAIGCIGATDTHTSSIIKNILEKQGIKARFAGSVVFDIIIEKESAAKAQNLLKTRSELKGAWIQYFNFDGKH